MKLSGSININRTRETVFDFTQDYSKRLLWDTFLREAYMLEDALPEVGKKAWCVSKHGIGMETEYISFRRPEVTAIKMSKGPWYISDFAGSWRFQQEGNSETKVIFTYSIKFRGMLEYLSKPFSFVLMKNIQQRLKDLKLSLEG